GPGHRAGVAAAGVRAAPCAVTLSGADGRTADPLCTAASFVVPRAIPPGAPVACWHGEAGSGGGRVGQMANSRGTGQLWQALTAASNGCRQGQLPARWPTTRPTPGHQANRTLPSGCGKYSGRAGVFLPAPPLRGSGSGVVGVCAPCHPFLPLTPDPASRRGAG